MTQSKERRRRFLELRIGFLTSLLAAFAVAIVWKAWDLQVRQAPELRERAEEQHQRRIKLAPRRGAIYDRDGAELAVSVDVDSVWVSPLALRKAKQPIGEVAHALSELLGVDEKQLADKIRNGKQFVWVKRRVTGAQGKAVRGLGMPGVFIQKEARRFYPNSELASHVLGFANLDGRGIEGLELMLENELRGPVLPTPATFDARGGMVFSQQLLDQRAAHGNDVTLTIDKTIQHVAERELELAVRMAEAQSGSIVALDPATGELLAVANYPKFNPNEPTRLPVSYRRNRAITDRFEPGSTIKPFTMAGALAAGTVRPNQAIDTGNGTLRIGTDTIRDSHRMDILSPAEVLAQSSNVGTAKIAMQLGRPQLHRTLTRFGFGEPVGLGLSGETSGTLTPYKRWYDLDMASISFGQGMTSSTLQLALAMGALANRGQLMEPILVKSVVDPQGQVLQNAVPRVRRQVVPESVARLVTDMMVGVTGPGGTGTEAAVDGYLVAGKTGTAQKSDSVNGGYSKDKWTASFVGYAPAQKPRLLLAVVIDEPMIAHQGGKIAGPVFRRVMEASLRHLGVPAESNGSLSEQVRARRQKLAADDPDNPLVVHGQPVPLLIPEHALPAPPRPGRGELVVPNLLGQTARDAVAHARRADFDVRVVGSGVVVKQEPLASSRAPRGSQLTLHLLPPSAAGIPASQTASRKTARGGRDG